MGDDFHQRHGQNKKEFEKLIHRIEDTNKKQEKVLSKMKENSDKHARAESREGQKRGDSEASSNINFKSKYYT